ncbi:glycosyltransferase family 4 protein [Bizionia hallyeonensis]|uniref:Glycosyltransferase family 4 protein n=1 Tax=Bizionia hallyeonensis TaxID=1123757 RepID=A0ABW0C628_9FLAO
MKTIGLVLSRPPAYSETFFNSKIQGLLENGFIVVLFTGPCNETYPHCEHKKSPKVQKNLFLQLINMFWVGFTLLPYLKTVVNYYKLEKNYGSSSKRIIEKIYLNSPLLQFRGDWLHYGFATLAINNEFVAQAVDAKMAVSFRGFDIDVYPLKHPGCYDLLWQRVDHVHTISTYLIERAYDLGLPKATPFQKITPAIALETFPWQSIKTFNTPIKMLTVSRLHWIKGLLETLEALAVLKQKGILFQYTIIGSGALYESLAFSIHQLDLRDSVVLQGQQAHDVVLQAMHTTDMYLQYSHSEGFCNAVLEAQGAGALCFVSDGGGLTENIINDQTGWVVPKRQPSLLAKRLEQVIGLTDIEKLKVREQARLHVMSHFGLEEQNKQFILFYQD